MKILNNQQIRQKIIRLSYEIYENHINEPRLIIAGLNRRGEELASLIRAEIEEIADFPVIPAHIHLNPASPKIEEIDIDCQIGFENESIIIVDDVANTGRTLFYASQPFLTHLPKSIKIAVLVDRKHKKFPIHVDYIGLSLATTLKEEILVHFEEEGYAAYLQ